MATNIFIAGFAFISGTLSARLLGSFERGELAAIQTWPTFLSTLAMLGIPDALVYFSAREPERAGQWMITGIVVALVSAIPFMILGYIILPTVLSAQAPAIIKSAQVYLWLIPLFAVLGMVFHPLRGRNDLVAWNLLRLLPGVIWVITILVGWGVGRLRAEFISLLYLGLLTGLIVPVGYTVFARVPGPFRFSRVMVLPLMKYGAPSVLSTIPSTLNLRLDQMLMTAVMDAKFLGLYVVAVSWSGVLSLTLTAISSVLFPKIASIESFDQQKLVLSQSLRVSVFLSLCVALFTASITPWGLTAIFGQEYRPAVTAGIIMSFATGIMNINQALGAVALSLNYPRCILYGELSGFLITGIGLLFTLQTYKIIGASVVSLTSYLIIAIILLLYIKKITSISLVEMLVINSDDLVKLRTSGQQLFGLINKAS